MDNWAKLRSWHYVRTFTRVPGGFITMCGRSGRSTNFANQFPSNEKSCESCLRIIRREHAETFDPA